MNTSKRKENKLINQLHYNAMSSKTKDFIKKICYKKAASVDMTQHGFIADSKVHPIKLLMKPLKERLEKICGPIRSVPPSKQTPLKRNKKAMANSRTLRLSVMNKRIKPNYVKDGSKRRLTKIQNDKIKKKILKSVNRKLTYRDLDY